MQIINILNYIDIGHMALPEFQRGYVWNRDQVRGLFDSMYRRHPVGSLLTWTTESRSAQFRGEGQLAPGVVKLLLDGQQRITSLYGVIQGRAPKFFDGNAQAFTGLMFHVGDEKFEFYQPVKMKDDPRWVNVTNLFQKGINGLGSYFTLFSQNEETAPFVSDYAGRLSHLLGIASIDLHIEDISGEDKTLDVVVDIFNKVNSGGTKLSKGDLALAKICAEWPEARDTMKKKIKEWAEADYHFTLDWLLRSVNTVLTGEAKFLYLHGKNAEEIQGALNRAGDHIDTTLNFIGGRLGLDHDRVLFGRYAIPVMVRYLEQHGRLPDHVERDKLLFWYLQSGMWGRFSGSTESFIDRDMEALNAEGNPLDKLLEQLRLWHGGLRVEPGHFTGWSLGARFYPVLYWLTRVGDARDLGTGLPLKANLLGKRNKLEVHHIFPKAQLYKNNYYRSEVNALGNFCFLTKGTNLAISDHLPIHYFPEVESKHPGTLASQWIPMDEQLWKIENYRDFLEARKALLATEANRRFEDLLHGDLQWLEGKVTAPVTVDVPGGITSEEEEQLLELLGDWMEEQGLSRGLLSYDLADRETGQQLAVIDLAWPSGIQEELTEPVAVLLNEGPETLRIAAEQGLRCFTEVEKFKRYVREEILKRSR